MKAAKKPANVHGGSKDLIRGGWCTPKEWAERVGPWDLDPFSNPRSHIVSTFACMLERGDNGLANADRRGSYTLGVARGIVKFATEDTRVFFQPPYELVEQAFAHYAHTRFCALLRFSPDTKWFQPLYRASALVCVPRLQRIHFEPPPGVDASQPSHPHAFYFARLEDATPALLRACIAWRP